MIRKIIYLFVKSLIVDNRPSKVDGSIADERLVMVYQAEDGEFHIPSPAKFIDLHTSIEFTKPVEPPEVIGTSDVIQWSFDKRTTQQFEDTKVYANKDAFDRRGYLESAF
jgi:hypothetical protein